MEYKYGYREVTGCIPPKDSPSKFRLFWRKKNDNMVYFFTQTFVKDWDLWVPSTGRILIIDGGARVPLTKLDDCKDDLHRIVLWIKDEENYELTFQFTIKDHRSIQRFTMEELSNPENFMINVEEGQNRD